MDKPEICIEFRHKENALRCALALMQDLYWVTVHSVDGIWYVNYAPV